MRIKNVVLYLTIRLAEQDIRAIQVVSENKKYWVGVQQGQSYLMGRRCLFSIDWAPF